jgi:hypothetical protein
MRHLKITSLVEQGEGLESFLRHIDRGRVLSTIERRNRFVCDVLFGGCCGDDDDENDLDEVIDSLYPKGFFLKISELVSLR